MPLKLYCYVDESGQDTQGRLFVVGVVVAGEERDRLRGVCEQIERVTGKGNWKWVRAPHDRQIAYVRRILQEPVMRGKRYFAVFERTRDYLSPTIDTIVRAIEIHAEADYRVTLLVDGLPAALEQTLGQKMRRRGIRIRKVRGVRDEGDALGWPTRFAGWCEQPQRVRRKCAES
jgi:hypothetical protein